MSASAYPVGAVVSAVVANGLDQTIYAQDSKTDCTIAFLQRHAGARWVDIPACALGRPPLTVAIGPSLGRTVSFNPFSVHFGVVTDARPALNAGSYRVKFTYRSGAGDDAQEPLVAYSASFPIG